MIVRSRVVHVAQLALLAALLVAPTARLHAQAAEKPVIALSISSIDSLLGNIQYLTAAAGAPDFGQLATMMANPYTLGLDRTRPVGFVLSTNGQEFRPLGFIPVKDLSKALMPLEDQLGPPRDAGNGIKELPGPQPIFLKEQDGWAFIGQTVESLATVPQNPGATIQGLPEDYDIAIRGNIQNVPRQYLDMAVTALQEGVKQGLSRLPEDERTTQEEMVKLQMKQLETFITQSDEITVGWKTDREGKRTYLDMRFTAMPGTDLAKQMAGMADAKSDYTGFVVPGSAMSMNFSSQVPQDQLAAAVDSIDNLKKTALREIDKDNDLKSPEAKQAARELLGKLMDIFVATMKTGTMDGGASVLLGPKSLAVVAGFHVADGAEVEKMLQRAAELAKNEPDFPGIKFNADQQGGVAFHTMSVPIPADEKAREVLGDTLELAIGTGKTSTYFGLGADCVSQLKKIIQNESKQKPVPPFELTFSLTPIMEFVASIQRNPVVGAVTESLQARDGNDQVKLHGIAIPNGFTYRIELEEGVLQAIGEGAKMANAGGF